MVGTELKSPEFNVCLRRKKKPFQSDQILGISSQLELFCPSMTGHGPLIAWLGPKNHRAIEEFGLEGASKVI